MQKIKILHVMPVFRTGGAEKLVLQYAQTFDKKVYEFHVACCVEDGELRSEFERAGVEVCVASRKTDGGKSGVYKKIEKYIEETKPDIIHTHLFGADMIGYKIKKKYGHAIQWISTLHNVEVDTSYAMKLVWKKILKYTDKVVVVSETVGTFASRRFKINSDKFALIPNGIEVKQWLPISELQLFSKEKLRIGTVGRLWEQKGHVYLLRALPLLTQFSYELHIFGDGPLKKKLMDEAEKLGCAEAIIWHGVTTDMAAALKDIDIVVQPSLWEGQSLVIMEAMAAARVVIATPAAGEGLILDTENGYIVPSKNPEALAEKIRFVRGHQKEAQDVVKNARASAKKYFDISKNIEALSGLYQNLVVPYTDNNTTEV